LLAPLSKKKGPGHPASGLSFSIVVRANKKTGKKTGGGLHSTSPAQLPERARQQSVQFGRAPLESSLFFVHAILEKSVLGIKPVAQKRFEG